MRGIPQKCGTVKSSPKTLVSAALVWKKSEGSEVLCTEPWTRVNEVIKRVGRQNPLGGGFEPFKTGGILF